MSLNESLDDEGVYMDISPKKKNAWWEEGIGGGPKLHSELGYIILFVPVMAKEQIKKRLWKLTEKQLLGHWTVVSPDLTDGGDYVFAVHFATVLRKAVESVLLEDKKCRNFMEYYQSKVGEINEYGHTVLPQREYYSDMDMETETDESEVEGREDENDEDSTEEASDSDSDSTAESESES